MALNSSTLLLCLSIAVIAITASPMAGRGAASMGKTTPHHIPLTSVKLPPAMAEQRIQRRLLQQQQPEDGPSKEMLARLAQHTATPIPLQPSSTYYTLLANIN